MSPSEQPKKCAACGADVTHTERMKDAKGRYICAPCIAKLKAKKRGGGGGAAATTAASAGASVGESGGGDQGADLREYMRQAKEAAKNQCPSCGSFAQPGAIICLNCGYDARTQSQLQTKFGTAKAAKVRGSGGGGGGSDLPILNSALAATAVVLAWLGIAVAMPVWMAIDQEDPDLVFIAGFANGVAGFVFWIFWIIGYFRRSDSTGKSVLVLILTFIFNFIGQAAALLWFSKEGANKLIRGLAVAVLIGICMNFILGGSGAIEKIINIDKPTLPGIDRTPRSQ
ncbi:MAG: zinc ribbon domain-containing protein [Phycisphaeraceae bacterium]|nr:zinc ribbon domain-containing protein [Phycisphaerales bacterium]MCB9841950.1 zinc ribbon domain-containing protein [Phycisphaeraceae bacterium]